MSTGFSLVNGKQYGAENAADTVTLGVSQRSYTPVAQLLGNVIANDGLGAYSLSNETLGENIARNWCRGNAKFRRTSCISVRPHQDFSSRHSCWGQGQSVFTRAYSVNGTRSEPLYKTKTGYYEILEVSPTATRAQIKTAYYKQSFVYHPDRNDGSEQATVRFAEVSEAYTVLGNTTLRKKYDRGLLSQADLTATTRPSAKDTIGSSAKPQPERRRSVMGVDYRGGIFDFDHFYKSHYSEQLQRQRDIRLRKEELLSQKQERQKKLGTMTDMAVAVLLAMAFGLMISLKQP
uniref:DnaJ homolog subfamily C member 30, mitochondrial n=2 Tax=Monopterus albus TaxID=43700 RepID=A0A3Q3JBI7_MONAL